MARSSKAKPSKSKKTKKSAKPNRELLAAANVGGIADFETFTLIRQMNDRLAERGPDRQAAKQARMVAAVAAPDAASDAPWVAVARGELGQRDYPGPRYNPRVVEYLKTTGLQGNDDETSWCSAFVNWCMLQTHRRGTNNAAAKSWLTFGQALSTPRPGCIVVLWRESPSSWKGHVGFFEGFDVGNRVRLLAGNQGGGVSWDEVCVTTFPHERILGFRWPLAG
jgi:uncharacterized protein (TIGR02594 family)